MVLLAIASVVIPGVGALSSAPAAAAAKPTVNVGDASTWEGDATSVRTLSFPVTLSDPVAVGSTVTVSYHLMSGSATAPTDFNDFKGATKALTFTAGGAQSKFVSVKVYPDTLDEGDETFDLMVLSVTGSGAVVDDDMATGTILDDDPGSGVRLGVSDVSVSEGDTGKDHAVKFWVNLSQTAGADVTVHAMTMAMSATAGTDYVDRMMDLRFTPGQLHKAITVKIKHDMNPEPDEQFHVMLSNASANATIADDIGYGTIVSDDGSAFTTESFLIGPFDLSAMDQPGWENKSSGAAPRPAGSFGIKGMRFDIVDQNGAPVDMHDVHLHHIVMLDASRPDATCPSSATRFAGTGKERTPLVLGDDYAYKVKGTDPAWSAIWHVMNMSSQARTVYIKYSIDYVADNDPAAARAVTPYWSDVTGPCTNSEFDVPGNGGAGSVYSKSRTYTAPKNGTRVFVGGHIHDGGIDITMKRTASNQVVCTNTAVYPMPGMIHEISTCTNPTSVTAGEQFTTTARYDNSAPISAVMGIQLSYVYEP